MMTSIISAIVLFFSGLVYGDTPIQQIERADAYLESGKYEEAIAHYSLAIESGALNQDDLIVAHIGRADAYWQNSQLDLAVGDYDYVIKIAPDFQEAYYNRALINEDRGRLDLAIRDYSEAIRLLPTYYSAHINRGLDYYFVGEFHLAAEDFQAASELDQSDSDGLNNLAWLLATAPDETVRDGPRAVQSALKAVKLDPSARNHDTLAAAYAEAGQFEDAKRELTTAIQKLGNNGDPEILAGYEMRLKLYSEGRPYREDPGE